ncbi:MAG TPA: YciI family protein [Solirubrobacteraceae bacterium]|jgi:hypothetical protein
MKYAMLVYATPGSHDLPEAEFAQVMSEYEALRSEPGYVTSAQLQPAETATTLRASHGQTLTTDGPFADTKEVFGGFYVFDVDDLDAALAIARRIPALRLGDAVEIRPAVG